MRVDIKHEIKKGKPIFKELYVYYIGLKTEDWIGLDYWSAMCDGRCASGGGKADECAEENFINT